MQIAQYFWGRSRARVRHSIGGDGFGQAAFEFVSRSLWRDLNCLDFFSVCSKCSTPYFFSAAISISRIIPGIEKIDVLGWAIWLAVMTGHGRHRVGHDDWAVLIVGESILPRPGIIRTSLGWCVWVARQFNAESAKSAEHAEKEAMALRAAVSGTTALPDVLPRPQGHVSIPSALLTWQITAARGYFPMRCNALPVTRCFA